MLKWLWLSVIVFGLDHLTKYIASSQLVLHAPVEVLPFLNMMLAHNTGAAFSFLSDASGWQRWFFAGFAVVMSAVLVIWLLRLASHERLLAAALSLVTGGAVGNLIDRIHTGRVVDFIDVHAGEWHWPAFNVADSAITVGVILLLLTSLRGDQEDQGGVS